MNAGSDRRPSSARCSLASIVLLLFVPGGGANQSKPGWAVMLTRLVMAFILTTRLSCVNKGQRACRPPDRTKADTKFHRFK